MSKKGKRNAKTKQKRKKKNKTRRTEAIAKGSEKNYFVQWLH